MKLKVETTCKERYQQLLNFININGLKFDYQHPSSQYITPLPMTPIINSSFNKHPMSWEIINLRLIHLSNSVMKEMCHNQTLDGLTINHPKKLNKAPCKICYTAKVKTFP